MGLENTARVPFRAVEAALVEEWRRAGSRDQEKTGEGRRAHLGGDRVSECGRKSVVY